MENSSIQEHALPDHVQSQDDDDWVFEQPRTLGAYVSAIIANLYKSMFSWAPLLLCILVPLVAYWYLFIWKSQVPLSVSKEKEEAWKASRERYLSQHEAKIRELKQTEEYEKMKKEEADRANGSNIEKQRSRIGFSDLRTSQSWTDKPHFITPSPSPPPPNAPRRAPDRG